MRARIGALGVVLFLLTALVSAQVGQIAGIVRDTNGVALPGVTVEVSSPALVEKARSTVTDQNGRYSFTSLPVGNYRVTFRLASFLTRIHENVVLTTDSVAPVNAELTVGGISEVVTVTGAAATADVQNGRQRQTFTGEELRELPTTRDLQSLVNLVPGIAMGDLNQGRIQADGLVVAGAHQPPSQESYARVAENVFKDVSNDPLSTFSIDVDTASYANVRRFLSSGTLPPRDAVRVEEMINYFRFDYPQPRNGAPFSVTTELAESPWNPGHRLALIGLQGRDTFDDDRTPRNLVFLIDVSGSMQPADRLPLIKSGMRMLVDTLQPRDHVAIVVYASSTGVVLPTTPGDRKETIHRAIENLQAGGSTNGGAGIRLAYELARKQFAPGGVNRVILATDGDFNVGVTSHQELENLIEEERKSGVFLSILGVGTGNLKDSRMEMLADKGNGNYAYLDSLQEAQRVLVREAASTLETIAKDVKIQVEFNPRTVKAYRLIGYENRMLKAQDFNDDRKDAGEIGAGHSVTALYEIIPVGMDVPTPVVDALKYQPTAPAPVQAPVLTRASGTAAYADELMTVKLRYKDPAGETSRLISTVIRSKPQPMTANLGFASAVAELGMLLKGSQYSGSASYEALTLRARRFRGIDPDGYRAEFIKLSELARSLRTLQTSSTRGD